MDKQTMEEMREEWIKWLGQRFDTSSPRFNEILDLETDVVQWWMDKLNQVLEEDRKELREKIKKLKASDGSVETMQENETLDEVLSLLDNPIKE